MTEKDKEFLLSLIPDWAKKTKPGLCSTMYGTGSYIGDCAFIDRVHELLIQTYNLDTGSLRATDNLQEEWTVATKMALLDEIEKLRKEIKEWK